MTLALPKEGLRHPSTRSSVGELYLADISVPPKLYQSSALGLPFTAPFGASDVVRVVGW